MIDEEKSSLLREVSNVLKLIGHSSLFSKKAVPVKIISGQSIATRLLESSNDTPEPTNVAPSLPKVAEPVKYDFQKFTMPKMVSNIPAQSISQSIQPVQIIKASNTVEQSSPTNSQLPTNNIDKYQEKDTKIKNPLFDPLNEVKQYIGEILNILRNDKSDKKRKEAAQETQGSKNNVPSIFPSTIPSIFPPKLLNGLKLGTKFLGVAGSLFSAFDLYKEASMGTFHANTTDANGNRKAFFDTKDGIEKSRVGMYGKNALEGATIGATIGSFIAPGIGTAIGAAIGAGGGLVYSAVLDYKKEIGSALESTKNVIVSGFDSAVSFVSHGIENTVNAYKTIVSGVKSAYDSVKLVADNTLKFAQNIGTKIANVWNTGTQFVKDGYNGLVNGVSSAMTLASNVVSLGIDAAKNGYSNLVNGISNVVSLGIDAAKNGYSNLVNGISNAMTLASNVVSSGASLVQGAYGAVVQGASTTISTLTNGFADSINFIKNIGTTIGESIASTFSNMKNGLLNIGTDISNIFNGLKTNVSDSLKFTESAAKSLEDKFMGLVDGAKKDFDTFTNNHPIIKDAVNVVSAGVNDATTIAHTIIDKTEQIFNNDKKMPPIVVAPSSVSNNVMNRNTNQIIGQYSVRDGSNSLSHSLTYGWAN